MKKVKILNLDIHNWTINELLDNLEEGLVVTPNMDHLIKLQKDEVFYNCYQKAEHVVCDSRIIQVCSKWLYPGKGIIQQIAGSDLFPAFCKHHSELNNGTKIFLLGGTENSVKVAKKNINNRYNSEIIVETYSPPFGFEFDKEENEKIINYINKSGASVLAVGLGAPKQEKWITTNRKYLSNIKIYFAIGATISFESGLLKRAPRWISRLGLEWLYRMVQDPKRLIKRYLIDDSFVFWLLIKQRFGYYKNPWSNK